MIAVLIFAFSDRADVKDREISIRIKLWAFLKFYL